jgi:FtsH-binding integral membrane protein
MAEFDRQYTTAARGRAGAGVETLDQGLRAFMLGIYTNMAIGLAITGVVAYAAFYFAVAQDPATAVATLGSIPLTAFGAAIYASALRWVIMLAPLAFVFGLSAMVHRMQPATARLVFLAFAPAWLKVLGWLALALMTIAIVALGWASLV